MAHSLRRFVLAMTSSSNKGALRYTRPRRYWRGFRISAEQLYPRRCPRGICSILGNKGKQTPHERHLREASSLALVSGYMTRYVPSRRRLGTYTPQGPYSYRSRGFGIAFHCFRDQYRHNATAFKSRRNLERTILALDAHRCPPRRDRNLASKHCFYYFCSALLEHVNGN